MGITIQLSLIKRDPWCLRDLNQHAYLHGGTLVLEVTEILATLTNLTRPSLCL